MSQDQHATTLAVGPDDGGKRLDAVIRRAFPGLSMSVIYRALRTGQVLLNEKRARHDTRVENGDRIDHPWESRKPPSDTQRGTDPSAAERILKPLVLFEDDSFLVINKPRGLAVHGPDSLELLVQAYRRPVQAASLSFRPGPVHRLDRNTTGVQVFALSSDAARTYSTLQTETRVKKLYLAVFSGSLPGPSTWEDRLERDEKRMITRGSDSGKVCITHVTPVGHAAGLTMAVCELVTGRTHQIRAQSSLHGHPLIGDGKYGGSPVFREYLLHAAAIGIQGRPNPLTFDIICAPPPLVWNDQIERLFGSTVLESAVRTVSGMISG